MCVELGLRLKTPSQNSRAERKTRLQFATEFELYTTGNVEAVLKSPSERLG